MRPQHLEPNGDHALVLGKRILPCLPARIGPQSRTIRGHHGLHSLSHRSRNTNQNSLIVAASESYLQVPAATSVEGRTLKVHYVRRDKDVQVNTTLPLPVLGHRIRSLSCA